MDSREVMNRVGAIIEAHGTGLLATVDEEGNPHLRWLTPTLLRDRPGRDLRLTAPRLSKVVQVRAHAQVEWMFQTPTLDEVISIRGAHQRRGEPLPPCGGPRGPGPAPADVLEARARRARPRGAGDRRGGGHPLPADGGQEGRRPFLKGGAPQHGHREEGAPRRAQFEAELLGKMLLIRRFEEKAAQMYGLKKIGGFCHLYIGQEAAAVGAIAAHRPRRGLHGGRLPGPRLRAGLRHGPQGAHGGAVRQGHGRLQGQGRLHALLRRRAAHVRRQRHRRRPDPRGNRGGAEVPLPQGRRRGAVLVRRRRHPPGLVPREPQHGKDLEPAHRLHLREQPVRHGHGLPPRLLGHRLRGHGRLLRHPRQAGQRHGRGGGVPRRGRGGGARPAPSPRPCSWRSRPTATAATP